MIRRTERPVNKPTWATIRNWGPGGRAAVVAAAMLLLYAAAAPWAYWLNGLAGLLAAGISAAVCLLGAAAALFLSHRFRGPARAVHAMAFSMAARTGLPLILVLVTSFCAGPLVTAGAVYYVVVFYLAAMAIEVPLSIIGMQSCDDKGREDPNQNDQCSMTND